MIGNFFDDCMVITDSPEERQRSMDESDLFDRLTGQKTGHKKLSALMPQRMDPNSFHENTNFNWWMWRKFWELWCRYKANSTTPCKTTEQYNQHSTYQRSRGSP